MTRKTQPFKTLAENIHPVTHSIVLFTDEGIFTLAIPKNPCIAWPTVRICSNQEERRL